MLIIRRLALALLLAVSFATAAPPAHAHDVVCTNDPQTPFFNNFPEAGRETLQGATIIECSPTAPDAQRTEVQLQATYPNGVWNDKGDSTVSFSNAQFHRKYDSTGCRVGTADVWRTKAIHSGTHGNTVIKTRYSPLQSVYCYFRA